MRQKVGKNKEIEHFPLIENWTTAKAKTLNQNIVYRKTTVKTNIHPIEETGNCLQPIEDRFMKFVMHFILHRFIQ